MATPNPIVTTNLIEVDWAGALDQLMGRDITNGAPGWAPSPNAWVYVSATSFKVVGVDVRNRYPVGTKISLTDAAATKYFYVVSSAFSTDTTITVTGGSAYSLAGGAITNPRYSYVSPQGFPDIFAYTPTMGGWSGTPTNECYFSIEARKLIAWIWVGGTSTTGATTVTIPVASAATYPAMGIYQPADCQNASGAQQLGCVMIPKSGSTLTFCQDSARSAFATSGYKEVETTIVVPI